MRLMNCIEKRKKEMIEELALFKGPLREILEKELVAGNEIKETCHGLIFLI